MTETQPMTETQLPITEVSAPALESFPEINADLIAKYGAGASDDGLRNLKSLFDFLNRCKARAEYLAEAYRKQLWVLHDRLEGTSNPSPGTPKRAPNAPSSSSLESVRTASGGSDPKQPAKKNNKAVDLDLDLDLDPE